VLLTADAVFILYIHNRGQSAARFPGGMVGNSQLPGKTANGRDFSKKPSPPIPYLPGRDSKWRGFPPSIFVFLRGGPILRRNLGLDRKIPAPAILYICSWAKSVALPTAFAPSEATEVSIDACSGEG